MFTAIYNYNNLFAAWQKIKKKSSAGGIDNISVVEFTKNEKKNIILLQKELFAEEYTPEPYKIFFINKNETERRKIALLSVRDKIVQTSIKIVIEPVMEKKFTNANYGYRKNKNTEKAIRRTLHIIKHNKKFVARCDIDNFFDEIDHNLLFGKLERFIKNEKIFKLIRTSVLIGDIDNANKWTERKKGIPQGGILSPLLANFFLQPLDWLCQKNKYGYVRYADDIIILHYNQNQINSAMQKIENFLNKKLLLKFNKNKTIGHCKHGFEFLGVKIINTQITINDKKKEQLNNALKQNLILKNNKLPSSFFETQKGIKNYYAKLLEQSKLEELDNKLIENITIFFAEQFKNEKIKNRKQVKNICKEINFFSDKIKAQQNDIVKQIAENSFNKTLSNAKKVKTKKTVLQLIKVKQKKYEEIEAAGKELILKTPGTFVGKFGYNIVVKLKRKTIHKANVQNLNTITLISKGITISTDAIQFCAKNNIAIDFLQFNGKPYAKLHTPIGMNNDILTAQTNSLTNGKAQKYIKKLIASSIKNRTNLLKYYAKYHLGKDPDFTKHYSKQITKMKNIYTKVLNLEEQNLKKLQEQIFILEAQAAQSYWFMVEKFLNDYIAFPGRKHQEAADITNVMLNYGYGILYARVWRALIKAKLNPYIGLLHSNKRNDPALVFDFIEEFRQQAVDRVVFTMIAQKEKIVINEGKLSKESKTKLAQNIMEQLNGHENFRKKRMTLEHIITKQAKDLARFFTNKIKTHKPYITKW